VENFFKNILNDNTITPPEPILNHFQKKFANAVFVEWYSDNEFYEAIFYEDDFERIAKYDLDNNFINVKTNISPNLLPESIKEKDLSYGELMNCIIIDNKKEKDYEIIYRDSELIRYLLFLDQNGTEIKHQKL